MVSTPAGRARLSFVAGSARRAARARRGRPGRGSARRARKLGYGGARRILQRANLFEHRQGPEFGKALLFGATASRARCGGKAVASQPRAHDRASEDGLGDPPWTTSSARQGDRGGDGIDPSSSAAARGRVGSAAPSSAPVGAREAAGRSRHRRLKTAREAVAVFGRAAATATKSIQRRTHPLLAREKRRVRALHRVVALAAPSDGGCAAPSAWHVSCRVHYLRARDRDPRAARGASEIASRGSATEAVRDLCAGACRSRAQSARARRRRAAAPSRKMALAPASRPPNPRADAGDAPRGSSSRGGTRRERARVPRRD